MYNRTIKKGSQMSKALELETELLSLKAELEAENFSGSTEDENPDPRLTEMMNDLLILEVFYFEDYRKLVNTHFV